MDYKSVALMLLCLVCLAGVSCGGFIDRFTPCEVTEQSMTYADRDNYVLKRFGVVKVRKLRDRQGDDSLE